MNTKIFKIIPYTILKTGCKDCPLSRSKLKEITNTFILAITAQVFLLSTLAVLLYQLPIVKFDLGFAGVGPYIIAIILGGGNAYILYDLRDGFFFKNNVNHKVKFIYTFILFMFLGVVATEVPFHLSLLTICATSFYGVKLSLNSVELFKSTLGKTHFVKAQKPYTIFLAVLTVMISMGYFVLNSLLGIEQGTAIFYLVEILAVILIYFIKI